ncbi:pyroglutamyl-peptidase I [Sulfoacidibacillus thermotolerans]|uniref:Pyrrolidone-carboxylate peptidase n=1 Tax=Sulfoacidibacillus thermotolerans TaxID=1765684 RepID=A0A2U3DAU8_SULT2|nr:pyroglutamyl-peptidase I [Sulfoacidibacillus thermotolerans]PWI58404.1 pyroglutamyl-peptidase I [Sulfoacidibacillus thermotolerans]
MERRVLLTGFDAFGGETVNPASEIVKQLNGKVIEGTTKIYVKASEIPTVFDRALDVLKVLVHDFQPHVVICLGQAGGRPHISVERVAINLDDARIPDNEGNQPIDQPILIKGPSAYFSTLPIKRIVRELKQLGIPASISNTAGTFVCNHLFYGLMHFLTTEYPIGKGGFIHIPYLPSQVVDRALPAMSLADMLVGIEAAIRVSVSENEDLIVPGGTENG